MPLIEAQPDALARTYAAAICQLAEQSGGQAMMEQTHNELEAIVEIARTDKLFNEFLASRIVASADRAGSLTKILKGRVSDLTLHFLLVINDKGRMGYLPTIVAAVDETIQARFGRVEVDIYTAHPLDQSELEAVKARLNRSLDKETVVHPYTEPSMIGGIKVRIGDQLLDGSVATRLRKMKDRLTVDGAANLRARIDQILGN